MKLKDQGNKIMLMDYVKPIPRIEYAPSTETVVGALKIAAFIMDRASQN